MDNESPDPFGLRALITSRMTMAAFARSVDVTPQTLNNWVIRGLPSGKIWDAADTLGMSSDEMRPYTSEGRKPVSDFDAEIRRFRNLFRRLDARRKRQVLASLEQLADE